MKKTSLGLVVFSTVLFLTGCGDATVTGNAVKDVENITAGTSENINVYCPTGICTFELTASKATTVTVTMHYDNAKSFEKIEGVNVIGEGADNAKVQGSHQVTVDITKANTPVSIQVIDYYRN